MTVSRLCHRCISAFCPLRSHTHTHARTHQREVLVMKSCFIENHLLSVCITKLNTAVRSVIKTAMIHLCMNGNKEE